MDANDFGGGVAGAAGGLARWYQTPDRPHTFWDRTTAAVTSAVCGFGFGYLTQALVEWQLPSVPHTVAIGLAFVVGLASGVLSQAAVGLVSEVAVRLRVRVLDRFPESPDGAAPPVGGVAPAGQSGGAVGGVRPHNGSSVGAVAGSELRQPGITGGTTPPPG